MDVVSMIIWKISEVPVSFSVCVAASKRRKVYNGKLESYVKIQDGRFHMNMDMKTDYP